MIQLSFVNIPLQLAYKYGIVLICGCPYNENNLLYAICLFISEKCCSLKPVSLLFSNHFLKIHIHLLRVECKFYSRYFLLVQVPLPLLFLVYADVAADAADDDPGLFDGADDVATDGADDGVVVVADDASVADDVADDVAAGVFMMLMLMMLLLMVLFRLFLFFLVFEHLILVSLFCL